MATCQVIVPISEAVFLILYISQVINASENVIEYSSEDRKTCTYFDGKRSPNFEQGLVNCSWYSGNSCCKRTEVTSVFSSNLLPLYKANVDCRNRINYMMCYFCSPEQYRWYKGGKVHVCESFCLSVHKACQDAFYNGTRIGDVYLNGTAFCEAQNHKVVNSKYCFKYDPTVFDGADRPWIATLLQVAMLLVLTVILISQLS